MGAGDNADRVAELRSRNRSGFCDKGRKAKACDPEIWRYEDGDQSTVAESPDQLTEMNLHH